MTGSFGLIAWRQRFQSAHCWGREFLPHGSPCPQCKGRWLRGYWRGLPALSCPENSSQEWKDKPRHKRQQGCWRSRDRALYYPRNAIRWESLFVQQKARKSGVGRPNDRGKVNPRPLNRKLETSNTPHAKPAYGAPKFADRLRATRPLYKYYRREAWNSPFCVPGPCSKQDILLTQEMKNTRLISVGQGSALLPMKVMGHEKSTVCENGNLRKISNAAGGIGESPGDLEWAPGEDYSVTAGREGCRGRTSAVASEVRSSLHHVAEPLAQLHILPVGEKTRRARVRK